MLASLRMADLWLLLQLGLFVFLFITYVEATLDPIVIVGSRFFYKTNGSEFFIRGISYRQAVTLSARTGDPLADADDCQRDIPYLQELRTNVVRVSNINATIDHSKCMSLFDEAGIYVLVDLAPGDGSDPPYDLELYESFTSVIDTMQKYTNVLGFFAGSEVSPSDSFIDSYAFVKAAVRDMKAYIKTQNYRPMGIGIGIGSSFDNPNILDINNATFGLVEDYFNCGKNISSIDFLGLAVYSSCSSPSSYTQSAYSDLTNGLSNYSVPVFFSGYGCNTGGGDVSRTFDEVGELFASPMTDVFSGGIVFEYLLDSYDFGLVNASGTSASPLPDFHTLSTQMASVSPSSTESAAYKITNTAARACPTIDSQWQALETLPPTPNSTLCNCMFSSLSCAAKPGFADSVVAPTLRSQICNSNPSKCLGINQNVTSGRYEAYSACNTTQQISWVMNQDYLSNNSTSPGCDYNGRGQIQSVSPVGPQCQKLLDQAGPHGTGIVGTNTGIGQGKSRGLGPGAKAGIAIAVAFVSVLIGVGIFICGRKARRKRTPVPVEGGLEVGEAPPEFSALRRAELETTEIEHPSINQREFTRNEPAGHGDLFEGNELSAGAGQQVLDNTGVSPRPDHPELDGRSEVPELSGPSAPARGELSGDSTMRSELTPTNLPDSTATHVGQTTSQ